MWLRVALLASVAGCYTSPSTHPALVVDEAFTPAELAVVSAGVAIWPTATERVSWRSISSGGVGREDDTIYVVPESKCPCAWQFSDCGGEPNGLGPFAGAEFALTSSTRIVCLARYTPGVVAHELGHAIGLHHVEGVAVMAAGVTSEVPTELDLAQLPR